MWAWKRALQGVLAAMGAPLGWLLICLAQGSSVARELNETPGLYLYLVVGTASAFATFGFLIGRAEARLSALSLTDGLTGLNNTRYFLSRMSEAWADAYRRAHPVALILLDLDRFKMVNDKYGHAGGDHTLTNVAATLKAAIRESEVAARIGGEEFAILLPNTTAEQARVAAERVRKAIAECDIVLDDGRHISVTASLGVAAMTPRSRNNLEALHASADRALYQAKDAGRNCVVCMRGSQDTSPPGRPPTSELYRQAMQGRG